jgi:putative inorganic carbon (hco3(-)) transporter
MSVGFVRERPAPAYRLVRPTAVVCAVAAASVAAGWTLSMITERFGSRAPAILVGIPLGIWLWSRAARAFPLAPALVFLSFPIGLRSLPLGLNIVKVAVVLACGAVVLDRLTLNRSPLSWSPSLTWAAMLLGWCFAITPLAVSADLAEKQDEILAAGIILAAATCSVCVSSQALRRLMAVFVAGSAVTAAVAIPAARHFQAVNGGTSVTDRVAGDFGSPNQLGSLSAMAALVALGLLLAPGQRRLRIVAGVSLVPLVLALTLSFSRGAWIGMIIGLAYLLFRLRRARRAGLAVLTVLLLAGLIFHPSSGGQTQLGVVRERIANLTVASPNDARVAIWHEAERQVETRPWTGYGPGGFSIAATRSGSQLYSFTADHAHDLLLTWGAGTGIVGALLVIALCVSIARRLGLTMSAARGANHADEALLVGIAASLLTVLGQGIVDYTLPNSVIFFAVWALIGAVLGISNATDAQLGSPVLHARYHQTEQRGTIESLHRSDGDGYVSSQRHIGNDQEHSVRFPDDL